MNHTSERPFLIDMIRTDVKDYNTRVQKASKHEEIPGSDPGKYLFQIHSANHWMELEKNTPTAAMLFGELWYQDELCIMFADTNMGKSILAVQIGNSLAGREQIAPFGFEAPQCNVVYIDFELSGSQFRARYTHNDIAYNFNKSFYRAGYNPAAAIPPEFKNHNEYMNSAIEYAVKQTGADVLIIDNITCLRSGTEYASEAFSLMQHLKALKTKYKLSILVLAHTPKRNPSKPITRNDLQGSKMLINFCDSAFAIGESHRQKGLRYIKQIKQRATQEVYGHDNICLFRITKPINFLKYEFVAFGQEHTHLYHAGMHNKEMLLKQILELAAQDLSQRQISAKLNISLGMVNKYLNSTKE
ncbi:AAA family ATPase [Mucilaginibacter sp. X4EP1]|uniref:AAA family ATPase n=1 Tax=Mucilaginibacter sp. X4EP1 TaxID=2723092 RepID=UPI00216A7F01|nr:AAA family ATPase [Mucilaginibacter sp. X4EP1]MCS3814883.1 putative ATP-dependent serine protease [Mucilaginibacter sp. X4EP1]